MAVRRSVIQAIGGSDHGLGAGTRFPAAEDVDLGFRALAQGYHVCQTNRASLIHNGFRTHKQYSQLLRGYMVGTAAMYIKLIRCGYLNFISMFLFLCYLMLIVPTFENLLRLRRPPILGRALGLWSGVVQGLLAPVDRDHAVFVTVPAGAEANSLLGGQVLH